MDKKVRHLSLAPLEEENYKNGNGAKCEKVNDVWQEYKDSTTLHCIGHAANTHHNKYRRIFWCIVLLFVIALVGFESYVQIERYFKYSTITKHYTTMARKPQFPAVTLCNFNKIAKHKDMDNFTMELLRQTYVAIPTNMTYFNSLNETELNSVNLREMFLRYAPRIEHNFVSCGFNGNFVSCKTFFKRKRTNYGICAEFDVNKLNKNYVKHTAKTNLDGLIVTILVRQEDYFISETSAGFYVIVHDADDELSVDEDALSLSPGFSSRLAVQKIRYKYLPNPVKAFDNDYCLDTASPNFINPLKNHETYSYSGCIDECKTDYVTKMCMCEDALMTGNGRVCNALEVVTCLRDAYSSFANTGRYACNCRIPCEYESFRTTLSQSFYPREGYIEEYFKGLSNTTTRRDNLLQVRVFYRTSLEITQEQVLELTGGDIVASIGGFMGLFIGASIGSLIELMELIIMLITVKIKQTRFVRQNTSTIKCVTDAKE